MGSEASPLLSGALGCSSALLGATMCPSVASMARLRPYEARLLTSSASQVLDAYDALDGASHEEARLMELCLALGDAVGAAGSSWSARAPQEARRELLRRMGAVPGGRELLAAKRRPCRAPVVGLNEDPPF